MTRQEVFSLFQDAVRKVWAGNRSSMPAILNSLVLSSEQPAGGVFVSLAFAGPVRAIGDLLVVRAQKYTLLVADRLLSQSRDAVWAYMIHEAVHLGYPRHDAEFRKLVREHGGAVSEGSLTGGVRVERKEGARYKVVYECEGEAEAVQWAKQERLKVPGKYRLSF